MPPTPTEPSDPDLDLLASDIDLVPGDPPVPITVWRTPTADPAGGMSPRLAARLLSAYSRRGDVVHDATADPVFAQAIGVAGRRLAAAHRIEPAALVLTGWPPAGAAIDPVIVLGALRRRLDASGVVVALVAHPSGTGGPLQAGPLVEAARQARLSYLQHIVAVHAPTIGERIEVAASDQPLSGGARHLRVHTDLLVFTAIGGHRD